MKLLPEHNEFIDIHSHHYYTEEGVFRISNFDMDDDMERLPSYPVSAGLHPWHIHYSENLESLGDRLTTTAGNDSVIAIGETGIDRIIRTSLEIQEKVFRIHVDVSEKSHLPLIIHCVKAYDDIRRIRKDTSPVQSWIIHGFNSSPQMAFELTQEGFYISVGEKLLRNEHKSTEIMRNIPLSRVFAETDDDETSIGDIYDRMVSITGITLGEMKDYLAGNYYKVFGQ